jgi:hypothetical protein
MDLEQARPTVKARRSLSPTRNSRGQNPSRSRSRFPRYSVSIGSPSYTRRSTRRSPRRSPPRRSPPRQSPPRRSPLRRASSRRSPPRRTPPRRSPPRRNGCSWLPSSSGDTRDTRTDQNAYGPFTRRIREAPIPRGLEKPPQMDSYDGTTDPDEHIENIEAVLTYRSVQGTVKCKLFVTTLRRGTVMWYN